MKALRGQVDHLHKCNACKTAKAVVSSNLLHAGSDYNHVALKQSPRDHCISLFFAFADRTVATYAAAHTHVLQHAV